MSFGQVLFGFNGRINRAKYWLAGLFWIGVWFAAWVIMALLILPSFVNTDNPALKNELTALTIVNLGIGGVLFVALVIIPTIISGIAVGIKRLHDRNKSGWWMLVFMFGPGVLLTVHDFYQQVEGAWILGLMAVGIVVWSIVEFGFLRGTAGPNQYGPDPLAPAPTPAPPVAA